MGDESGIYENKASSTRFLDVFNSNSNELDNYDKDRTYDEDDSRGTDTMYTNEILILEDIKARHSFEKYESQSPISDKVILWCTKVAQHDEASWSKIQDITIPMSVEAKSNGDLVDLIIANILYTQSLKFIGNPRKSKLEDGYIHRIALSLFKAIFQSDTLFSYDWANGTLGKRKYDNNTHALMKPDFVVFVSGGQRDIAVGGIKPPSNSTATNCVRGVRISVVGGIVVEGEILKTFIMKLEFPRIYELVELSKTPLFQSIKFMTSLPTLISDLMMLKNILCKTAAKVMSQTAQKSTAERPTYCPSLSFLQFKSYKLN
ncbi:hypothetical protein BDC45DRAFT_540885 [Circinella umbellata]|nr:hypothetical protein BDC45DRAFT_540885 [Circinella umbellata]